MRALVILAPGAEEMEATITVDVLRRAGIDVVLAGLDGVSPVTCSRKVVITPDTALESIKHEAFDVLILPGGAEGARRLGESAIVGELLRERESKTQVVAAICAAPAVFTKHRVFENKTVTSHPSVALLLEGYCRRVDQPVVEDGALITSQGPGTTFLFALAIVARLCGQQKVDEIKAPMMFA